MRGQLKRNLRQAELIFPTLEINPNASVNVPGMEGGGRETWISVFQPRRSMCPHGSPCGGGGGACTWLSCVKDGCHPLKLMTPITASLHSNKVSL